MSIIVPNSIRTQLEQLKANNQIQNFNYLINYLLNGFIKSKNKDKELINIVEMALLETEGNTYEALYKIAEKLNRAMKTINELNNELKTTEVETNETKQIN